MQKLTKAEEEIMHWLWLLELATVSQLIERLPEPKPAQSTVSSFVRILEKKGFVHHEAFGKTHAYYPLVSKNEYGSRSLGDLVRDYFGGSASRLVSHLVDDEKLSAAERADLLKRLENLDNQ